MMVLVTRGHELLLASNVNFPPGRYSALAGFLEAGESVEAAIHREVAEEVGIQVHRPRYFGSQSWPFPHSLMIAFTAEWLAGDIHVDPTEIRDARPTPCPPCRPPMSASHARWWSTWHISFGKVIHAERSRQRITPAPYATPRAARPRIVCLFPSIPGPCPSAPTAAPMSTFCAIAPVCCRFSDA